MAAPQQHVEVVEISSSSSNGSVTGRLREVSNFAPAPNVDAPLGLHEFSLTLSQSYSTFVNHARNLSLPKHLLEEIEMQAFQGALVDLQCVYDKLDRLFFWFKELYYDQLYGGGASVEILHALAEYMASM